MKLGYQTNTWGGVVGHPVGVTSIKDLFYLTPGSTEEALRDIAAAGYAGFELFDGNLMEYAERKEEFKALLDETGLKLLGVYSGGNFIFPDVLPEELWRIERAAALAGELGALHLVVGGGAQRVGGPTEDDYQRLAAALDQVVDIAEKHGLTAHFHPHLTTTVETPEQLDKVMSRSRINFCADTAHIAAGGGDTAALIRRYPDRIRYIHLKDWRAEPFAFLPLGQGELDFPDMLAALDEIDYDGWITVELDSYDGPNREAAEISRAYLESLRPSA